MSLFKNREVDITRNIKTIEWLKCELLTDIAELNKILANGMSIEVNDEVAESLSNLIVVSYILGKRLGISYNAIEMKLENKIKLGLVENHDIEKYYGDLSELARHINSSRIRKADY